MTSKQAAARLHYCVALNEAAVGAAVPAQLREYTAAGIGLPPDWLRYLGLTIRYRWLRATAFTRRLRQ